MPEATEVEEESSTWWWNTAVEKSEKIIKELDIPWDDIMIDETDIQEGNLILLSEKLAKIAYYEVQVNNKLTRLIAVQAASKDALEHAVSRILARGDDLNGVKPKPSIEARRASIISSNDRLRDTKIELIESGVSVRSLELTKESLETLWKTISRILSARIHEPIDR